MAHVLDFERYHDDIVWKFCKLAKHDLKAHGMQPAALEADAKKDRYPFLYLGSIFEDIGLYDLAEQCNLRAWAALEDFTTLKCNADFYATTGRLDIAEKIYDQARIKGITYTLLYNLGCLYLATERYTQGIGCLVEAKKSLDDCPMERDEVGDIYECICDALSHAYHKQDQPLLMRRVQVDLERVIKNTNKSS